MKSRIGKWIFIGAICCGAIFLARSRWKKSAKLIPEMTEVSPDGNYRIEFYSVWTPGFMFIPGQGSDGIDGFVRLKHKDGRLIAETFRTYLYGCEIAWDKESVHLFGGDMVDWKLPK